MANKTEIKFQGISDMELAQKTMAGEFGNGVDRQNALGDRYDAVQNIINNGMKEPETIDLNAPSNPSPEPQEPKIKNEVDPKGIDNELLGDIGQVSDEKEALGPAINTDNTEYIIDENFEGETPVDSNTTNIENNVEVSAPPENNGVQSAENLANIEQATSQIQDFINGDLNDRAGQYINNPALGFNVTTNNLKYSISSDARHDLESLVAAEAIANHNDALATVSVILNRCDSNRTDPITIISSGAFAAYGDTNYQNYKSGAKPIPIEIKQAVEDGLNGIRNCIYTGFRSSGSTSYSNNQIAPGGNRYGFR